MGAAEKIPFSEAEAARKLGISKPTLARLRLAGQIHPDRQIGDCRGAGSGKSYGDQ